MTSSPASTKATHSAHDDGAIRLTTRQQLLRLAERATAARAPAAPFYVAAAAGQVALIVFDHINAPWSDADILRLTRPVIALVNGDPGWGERTYGPGRWRCATGLRRWARAAIIHGAAGERDHYIDGLAMAAITGRVAFIETTSRLANTWSAFLDGIPRRVHVPQPGCHHPVPPSEGVVH